MVGNMVLSQDFKEFIQSLNDNNVRYLVVGGYAVALHGHPRYTKDLESFLGTQGVSLEYSVLHPASLAEIRRM